MTISSKLVEYPVRHSGHGIRHVTPVVSNGAWCSPVDDILEHSQLWMSFATIRV